MGGAWRIYIALSLLSSSLAKFLADGVWVLRPLMIPPGKTTQMITPRHQGHINVSRKDTRQDGSSRLPPDACHQPSTTTTSSSTVIFQKHHRSSREVVVGAPVPLEHDDDDNTTAQPLITVELTSPEEAGLGADMIPLCAEGGWTVRYHRRSQ